MEKRSPQYANIIKLISAHINSNSNSNSNNNNNSNSNSKLPPDPPTQLLSLITAQINENPSVLSEVHDSTSLFLIGCDKQFTPLSLLSLLSPPLSQNKTPQAKILTLSNPKSGNAPIHHAAASGNTAAISLLLPCYPPTLPSPKNSNDDTPLHFATAYCNSVEAVALLLLHFPSSLHHTNKTGLTPLSCCVRDLLTFPGGEQEPTNQRRQQIIRLLCLPSLNGNRYAVVNETNLIEAVTKSTESNNKHFLLNLFELVDEECVASLAKLELDESDPKEKETKRKKKKPKKRRKEANSEQQVVREDGERDENENAWNSPSTQAQTHTNTNASFVKTLISGKVVIVNSNAADYEEDDTSETLPPPPTPTPTPTPIRGHFLSPSAMHNFANHFIAAGAQQLGNPLEMTPDMVFLKNEQSLAMNLSSSQLEVLQCSLTRQLENVKEAVEIQSRLREGL